MPNYNKILSPTAVRVGEVRFSYANVFAPKVDTNGNEKYSVQLLIPKTDTVAVKMLNEAIEAAKQAGVSAKWNGKMPPASKLRVPLRDGDEEFPEDDTYKGMMFMNCSSPASGKKPGVAVLENGQMHEALDSDDFYSGCWGCASVNFFAYNTSGNMGVGCGLNNVIKTRDDENLSGGRTAEQDFGDLVGGSYLD